MRLLMKRATSVGIDDRASEATGSVQALDLRSDVVEALSTEKEAVLRSLDTAFDHDERVQRRMRVPGSEGHVDTTTLRIEAPRSRYCLQKCGFPTAILADEDGYGSAQFNSRQSADRWQGKRVGAERWNCLALQTDRVDEQFGIE